MWRALAVAGALILYGVSISGGAYELTTPVGMAHHILLRKIYAVGAFTLLGFLAERSRIPRLRGVIGAGILLTLYSWAIEFGQIYFDHTDETFAEHTFDVASGLAGGALGAFVSLYLGDPADTRRRRDAIGLAIVFAALVAGYFATYALIDVAGRVR